MHATVAENLRNNLATKRRKEFVSGLGESWIAVVGLAPNEWTHRRAENSRFTGSNLRSGDKTTHVHRWTSRRLQRRRGREEGPIISKPRKKKKKKKRRRKKVARREAGSAVQFSRFSALREKRRDRFTNSRRRIAFFVGAFTLERASSPVGCACKPPSLPG